MINIRKSHPKAFFWSDLNFADDETCYLDQCQNDPCNGRGCKSTWDGKKAGFICECKFTILLLTRTYINSFIFISVNCHINQLFNKYIKYIRFVRFYKFWLPLEDHRFKAELFFDIKVR